MRPPCRHKLATCDLMMASQTRGEERTMIQLIIVAVVGFACGCVYQKWRRRRRLPEPLGPAALARIRTAYRRSS